MLVSVITPSYKRAWTLQNCIDSVRNQTYKNIEHIVVDACSNDGTLEILEKNKPFYDLRWISEKDQGMYDAINKGIKMASGEIIAYLNTDDFYFPYTIEHVVAVLNRLPQADLLYGDWVTYYTDSQFLEVMPYPTFDRFDMAGFACLPQTAVFMRRSTIERTGEFDISYKLMADNEYFSRAVVKGLQLVKTNEVLAGQTVHAGNLLAGNPKAVATADAEAHRYRQQRAEELQLANASGDSIRRYWAKLHAKGYPIVWRMMLIEFLFRATLTKPRKWERFIRIFPVQNVNWINLVRYLVARKQTLAAYYCLAPDFKPWTGNLGRTLPPS